MSCFPGMKGAILIETNKKNISDVSLDVAQILRTAKCILQKESTENEWLPQVNVQFV